MGHFIGYPKDSIGYEFYKQEDNKIITRCHAHFLKKELIQESGTGRTIVLKEVKHEERSS